MIPAHALHRLLVNLVDSASSIDIEQADRSDAAHREELENFAGTHDLDLEDTATLFRVGPGRWDPGPRVRTTGRTMSRPVVAEMRGITEGHHVDYIHLAIVHRGNHTHRDHLRGAILVAIDHALTDQQADRLLAALADHSGSPTTDEGQVK